MKSNERYPFLKVWKLKRNYPVLGRAAVCFGCLVSFIDIFLFNYSRKSFIFSDWFLCFLKINILSGGMQ